MTENEAVEVLKDEHSYGYELNKACLIAIKALKEIQQYRAIGTIDEFKALKEKSVAKKVIRLGDNEYYDYKCPTCGLPDNDCIGKKYCNCGQALEH